jgi:hypothetical protein
MQLTRQVRRCVSAALAALAWTVGASGVASAQTLYVNQTATTSGGLGYGYGNASWGAMTLALESIFGASNITVNEPDLSDLPTLLGYDRLWLDQRFVGGTLTATEIGNLMAFAATGRRMVMIGENSSWAPWNTQILGIVGGSFVGETGGTDSPVIAHPITAGVGTVTLPTVGLASGGTALFTANFATLWGPSLNVLTILDVNIIGDDVLLEDNEVFASNVAAWLAGPDVAAVPEPGTVALTATGLVVVAVGTRRRRRG